MSTRSMALALAALLGFASQSDAASLDLGVAWQGRSGMAERVFAGARERFEEAAAEIELDVEKALPDAAALDAAVSRFQREGKDGMIVLRSNGSAYLAANPPSIPTFIGGGNNPEALGVLADMARPDGNVTGVTYYLPPQVPLESFMTLVPTVRSFLLVTEEGHPGSSVDRAGAEEACAALAIECAVIAIAPEDMVQSIAARVDAFDAVIIGSQAGVIDLVEDALSAAGGKPVFAFADKGVVGGALGGVIPDDHKLGRMLADSVLEVLVEGRPISAVAVKTDPEPMLVINMSTAARLGVEPPIDLLAIAKIIR